MRFKCHGRYNLSIFELVFTTIIFLFVCLTIFCYLMQNNGKTASKNKKVTHNYPGEMGAPVHLPHELPKRIKHLINLGWQKHKFNRFISDLIPLNRSLPDARDEGCKQSGRYLKHLPATDIIICFHNEAWSTLLRTVHSVINRSPNHLIGKIILVDDQSNEDYLKEPLDTYFSTFPKVQIVRSTKRLGVAKARLMGMKYSTAAVLTYLDSHCECLEGWLEPLLDRIARNRSNVVTPFIDYIDKETFKLIAPPLRDEKFIGGFNWNLDYSWFQYFAREKQNNQHAMEPVPTPTLAGGIFTIDRKFFQHLGTYDSGFQYWGAENLELSFKTWMCGGRLEAVHCSRVGHVFRLKSPYNYPHADEVIAKNLVRLAEVWLDDYAQIFYGSMGHAFNVRAALTDVSDSKLLRKKLGCNSFKWYLENIYPEKFVPVAFGAIVQKPRNMCLEAEDRVGSVRIRECHDLGENQFWMIGNLGEIRKDDTCLSGIYNRPLLKVCTNGSDHELLHFNNRTHRILHKESQKCLTIGNNSTTVFMTNCRRRSRRQHWHLK